VHQLSFNVTLLAVAAGRGGHVPRRRARQPPLSIDISCPHSAQQQNPPTAVSRWDRQADEQTN